MTKSLKEICKRPLFAGRWPSGRRAVGRRTSDVWCLALNFGRCADVRRFTLDVGSWTLNVGWSLYVVGRCGTLLDVVGRCWKDVWTLGRWDVGTLGWTLTLDVGRSAVGRLDVWTFGRLDVWTFRRLDVWTFGRLDVRTFGCWTLEV